MSALESAPQVMVDAAKKEAGVQAVKVLQASKAAFLLSLKGFMKVEDIIEAGTLFDQAMVAMFNAHSATDPEKAQEFTDEYDLYMARLETMGDRYLISGETRAGLFVRTTAHLIIAGGVAILGAAIQAGLTIFVPLVGGLVGTVVNVGMQKVSNYFLGD